MNPMKPLEKISSSPIGAVLTAIPQSDGAVALFYPGVQERLSEMSGGDYYVVFTAKDEAHIHPARTTTLKKLRELLWDSNHHFPQDMLTANVYYYDAKQKKLKKA